MTLLRWLLPVLPSVLLVTAQSAQAVVRIVNSNTLTVIAQSLPESQAHIVSSNQTLVNCPSNRVYIDPANRELFAEVLTVGINNKPVSIAYEDAAPIVTTVPHGNVGCKLLSVWWQ